MTRHKTGCQNHQGIRCSVPCNHCDDDKRKVEECACFMVKNIAGLSRLRTRVQQARALVLPLDQYFELDKNSTATPDGITIVAARNGGNWLRIESPSKIWSQQLNWYIDPQNATSSDENNGANPATPLKNVAEAVRRLHQIQAGESYTLNLLSDSLPTDRFRPTYVLESNVEAIDPVTGNESVVNFVLSGVDPTLRPALATGVVGAGGYTATAAGVQAHIDLGNAALPGANIGKFIVITTPGPLFGAMGGIGFDLGGGVAKVSEFRTPAPTNGAVVTGAIPPGTTFNIITMTAWNGDLIQLSSLGRHNIQNLLFPAPLAPPSGQETITTRYNLVVWSRCIFQRPVDVSALGAAAFNVCILDYSTAPTFLQNGIGGTVIVSTLEGGINMLSTLMIKADYRLVNGTRNRMSGVYVQGGRVTGITNSNFITYTGTANTGTCVVEITLFGSGLGIYDWPVVPPIVNNPGGFVVFNLDAAFTLSGGSQLNIVNGADLYGTNVTVGGFGLRVNGGSKFLWLNPTPGTHPHLTGSVAGIQGDIQLENNSDAIPPLELTTPAVGALAPLNTWAQWSAAPFSGAYNGGPITSRVMNYGTGSSLSQVSS